MGGYGGYYFGEKKKLSKKHLAKKADKMSLRQSVGIKLPEIIKKK